MLKMACNTDTHSKCNETHSHSVAARRLVDQPKKKEKKMEDQQRNVSNKLPSSRYETGTCFIRALCDSLFVKHGRSRGVQRQFLYFLSNLMSGEGKIYPV